MSCLLFVADCCKSMALGEGGQTSRLIEAGKNRHQKEMNAFLTCRLRRCCPDTLRKGGQNPRQGSLPFSVQLSMVLGGRCCRPMYLNRKKCADSSMHWAQTMFWTGTCHWNLPSHFGQEQWAPFVLHTFHTLIHFITCGLQDKDEDEFHEDIMYHNVTVKSGSSACSLTHPIAN